MAVIVDTSTACVQALLCGLSTAAKTGLRALILSQRAAVQGAIVAAEAKLLAHVPEVTALTNLRSAIQDAVEVTQDLSTLVPATLMLGCALFGDFQKSVADIAARIGPNAGVALLVLDDLNRALAFRDELTQLVTQLNTILDGFTLILDTLDLC